MTNWDTCFFTHTLKSCQFTLIIIFFHNNILLVIAPVFSIDKYFAALVNIGKCFLYVVDFIYKWTLKILFYGEEEELALLLTLIKYRLCLQKFLACDIFGLKTKCLYKILLESFPSMNGITAKTAVFTHASQKQQ